MEVINITTDYIYREELEHVLAALTPPNRLIMEVCLQTGLRLSDVLSIRVDKLAKRMTVCELKTGKRKRVCLTNELYDRCLKQAGRYYVFEGRLDAKQHRSRQAVWRDVKRAAKLMRYNGNIAPHSARKVYAVDAYHRTKDLRKVQAMLNHADVSVTMLYALADTLVKRRIGDKP